MEIHVDRETCTGLGVCEVLAPEVFEIDDEGLLRLLRSRVDETLLADVEQAIVSCPTSALRLVRET